MTKRSNFWADMATFALDESDVGPSCLAGLQHVSSEEGARVLLAAIWETNDGPLFDAILSDFVRDTGRTPPAKPCAKAALESLADKLDALVDSKSGDANEHAFNLGLKCAAAMARTAPEDP